MPEIFLASVVSHTTEAFFLPVFGRITRRTRRRCSACHAEAFAKADHIPLVCSFAPPCLRLRPASRIRAKKPCGKERSLPVRQVRLVRRGIKCAVGGLRSASRIRANRRERQEKFVRLIEYSVIRSYFIREFLDITYGRQADSLQVW